MHRRVPVGITALLLLGSGLFVGSPPALAAAATPPAQTVSAVGQDAAHSGTSPLHLGSTLKQLWQVSLPAEVGQPVVAKGRVLVTSGGWQQPSDGADTHLSSQLHELDLATGRSLLGVQDVTRFGVSTDGSRALVGSSAGTDAIDLSTGKRAWLSAITPDGDPVADGSGNLYVASGGGVEVVQASTGTIKQELRPGPLGGITGGTRTPAVLADSVVVCDYGQTCSRISKDGKKLLWQHTQGTTSSGSLPVVGGSTVIARGNTTDAILDLATGKQRFVTVPGPAAADSTGVYVASTSSSTPRVVNYDPKTGAQRWVTTLPAVPVGNLLLTADRVIVLDKAGTVHLLDRTTGKQVGTAKVAAGSSYIVDGWGTTPGLTIADGVLLVASGRSVTAFLGTSVTQAPASVTPTPSTTLTGGAAQTGGTSVTFGGGPGRSRDSGVVGVTGSLKTSWTRALSNPSYPVQDSSGRLVVSTSDGVYRLNSHTGATVWGPVPLPSGARGNPTLDGNAVFLNGTDSSTTALDLNTGHRLWTTNLGSLEPDGYVTGAPAAGHGMVYVLLVSNSVSNGTGIVALNQSSGAIAWTSATVSTYATTGPLLDGNQVTVTGIGRAEYVIDATTGKSLWHEYLGNSGGGVSNAVTRNGLLYVDGVVFSTSTHALVGDYVSRTVPLILPSGDLVTLNGDRLLGRHPDGRTAWTFAPGKSVTGTPVAADGRIFTATSDGKLYALNPATGAVTWTGTIPEAVAKDDPNSSVPLLAGLAAAKGHVYAATPGHLTAFAPTG